MFGILGFMAKKMDAHITDIIKTGSGEWVVLTKLFCVSSNKKEDHTLGRTLGLRTPTLGWNYKSML